MEVFLIIVGIIAALAALIIFVRFIQRITHNAKARKGWTPFAQAQGLRLDPGGMWGGPVLSGERDGRRVEISLIRVNRRFEGRLEGTRFCAYLTSPLPSGIAVGHRSIRRFLARRVRSGSFVKTGNAALDGYVRVRTDDPNLVRRLMDHEKTQQFFSHFVAGRSLAMVTDQGAEFCYDEMELGSTRLEVGVKTVVEAAETFEQIIRETA
jgi:hypothetical protein